MSKSKEKRLCVWETWANFETKKGYPLMLKMSYGARQVGGNQIFMWVSITY
jgi:hypothetical protein